MVLRLFITLALLLPTTTFGAASTSPFDAATLHAAAFDDAALHAATLHVAAFDDAALHVATPALGKDAGTALLQKMTDAINSFPALKLKIEISAVENDGTLTGFTYGELESEGQAFKFISEDFQLLCDGKSKWIYNVVDGEVTIVVNDTTQIDMVENPIGFLNSLSQAHSQYKVTTTGVDVDNSTCGGGLWGVELAPKSKYSPYESLTLCLQKESYLPSLLIYRGAKGSGDFTISITELKENSCQPISYYQLETTSLSNAGVTVTDLR